VSLFFGLVVVSGCRLVLGLLVTTVFVTFISPFGVCRQVRFTRPRLVPHHSLVTTVLEVLGCCIASSKLSPLLRKCVGKEPLSNLREYLPRLSSQLQPAPVHRRLSELVAVATSTVPGCIVCVANIPEGESGSGARKVFLVFSGQQPITTIELTQNANENTTGLNSVGRRQRACGLQRSTSIQSHCWRSLLSAVGWLTPGDTLPSGCWPMEKADRLLRVVA